MGTYAPIQWFHSFIGAEPCFLTDMPRWLLCVAGLGNSADDYEALAQRLRSQGLAVEVAQVARLDWGRNALALTDGNWWRGTLSPRPAVDW